MAIETTRENRSDAGAKTISQQVQEDLIRFAGMILKKPAIDPEKKFGECGFDSVTLTQLAYQVYEQYGIELELPLFFRYASVLELTEYFCKEYGSQLENYYVKKLQAGFKGDSPSTMKWTVTKI
jgi:acyl carrier protein